LVDRRRRARKCPAFFRARRQTRTIQRVCGLCRDRLHPAHQLSGSTCRRGVPFRNATFRHDARSKRTKTLELSGSQGGVG